MPEQSLARLKLAMQAKIAFPGIEGEVEARVRLISEEVDKTTRLGKVRFALPPGAPARIGSFASGVAIVARRSGVAVPTSAVTRGDDGDFVEVVKDGRIEQRKITAGITNARLSERARALPRARPSCPSAAAFLRSGDLVRPIASPDAALRKLE